MKMPVAYLDVAARYVELAPHLIFRTPTVADLGPPVGLYLEQPWVGLTDEEKKSFWTADQMTQEEWDELFNAIEAKLKEKNT